MPFFNILIDLFFISPWGFPPTNHWFCIKSLSVTDAKLLYYSTDTGTKKNNKASLMQIVL